MSKRIRTSGLDHDLLRPGRREVQLIERRLFLKGALSMGGLALLTGCELTGNATVQRLLEAASSWNDRVQAALFRPGKLAPEYPESAITDPFPFNAYYPFDGVPVVDPAAWELELFGLIRDRRPWKLAELRALPQFTQVTRHICVEGWSAIGKWGGVRLSEFLERVGADTRARFVGFKCADDYHTSIDMATALHPQTQLTLNFGDAPLPAEYGFPAKVRIPTKLGFKNPKHVSAIFVTNTYPGGYWEDQGYNWFSGS